MIGFIIGYILGLVSMFLLLRYGWKSLLKRGKISKSTIHSLKEDLDK